MDCYVSINLNHSQMENNDILDFTENRKKPNQTKSLIHWWEKKRIYYNLLMLASITLVVCDLWSRVNAVGIATTIGYAIYFLFGANLFYTLGWASGLFLHFIYRDYVWNHVGRWSLFILGTLFSIFWMLIIFSDAIIFGL